MSNETRIAGNLTKDVIVRQVGKGKVANFTVAHNNPVTVRKNGQTTETQEVLFLNCEAWNRIADRVASEAKKGTAVVVTGMLRPNNYEKDGKKFWGIKLSVNEFSVLERGAAPSSNGSTENAASNGNGNVNPPTDDVFNEQELATVEVDDIPF